ncbi:MAG: pyruvate, phosphate dikinase [Bacteroidota bacterium]
MSNATKYVYRFGRDGSEGDKSMKQLLGGKGANLAEMSSIGLPVPPGFTISTEACNYYSRNNEWPSGLREEIEDGITYLQSQMGAVLGDPQQTLLVSVRSGAAQSMPGMMDTVLNLGLNDQVVEGIAERTDNHRFAYDSYRRFIDMFAGVVMGVKHEYFEEELEALKAEKEVENDTELSVDDLKELVARYKKIYKSHLGNMFPDDPREQLKLSINAVFGSWNSDRAVKYRRINRIKGMLGTAVNVQAMVFGNMGDNSATGVCFTRNPANGKNELYGEYLINAQGEDVVAGIRTPKHIDELNDDMPKLYAKLREHSRRLEQHYHNMQDIEFTIQDGRLFILQTRNGKRTGPAALKIAVDMVREGLASKAEAVRDLVEPRHLDQLLHPQLNGEEIKEEEIIGKGLPASPGAAVGKVVFSSEEAERAHQNGEEVILVRIETSPEDVGGMSAAQGILTSRGGMTSHAAVVARGWGKPCVAGCNDITIDYEKHQFTNGNGTGIIKEGDYISLDGTTGKVIKGKKNLIKPEFDHYYYSFMKWVDAYRSMGVRTNADTPEDATVARNFGAEGIGLTRTEHMFFGEDRIRSMRKMIIANSEEERRNALKELLPYQQEDFYGILKAMDGYPVTIRLLDPPLHEFLPNEEEDIQRVAEDLDIEIDVLKKKIAQLKEFNPMLGHRGCRLGITHPEITEMQAKAILNATLDLVDEGLDPKPEIMIPLIGAVEEFENQRALIEQTADRLFTERGTSIEFPIGTMVEVPRAALTASMVAEKADFFSFGTNDLTQLTYGFSRDDAGKFLPEYIQRKILPDDPFQVLDQEGVGRLVSMATKEGRSANPDLKVGICGEHGGEPSSIAFFYENKLNYVSCSPYRVPIARLAVAQSHLRDNGSQDTD